MHPTIEKFKEIASKGDEAGMLTILADQVEFRPPTYFATWTGKEPVAAVLGHVGQVFEDFKYRRVMGDCKDWALEFQCKIGELDAVGVDLLTLDDEGKIINFEVVMRPYKSIGALKEAMMQKVQTDARFLEFRKALS
ncbi:nuclear transport factor 2 family protein [Neptunicoccus cionae]|uniref:nuclear transport factor 2 family protein n=1 Tax=Neptunicoccus cionae TaxID=2035344 RepID=UPI000C76A3B1|nr:nuclear transport factor 2 family protein [Amylibacter cionae]PLS20039.1 nuclear transport factor 2 family protein [Amylibacter cionae]